MAGLESRLTWFAEGLVGKDGIQETNASVTLPRMGK